MRRFALLACLAVAAALPASAEYPVSDEQLTSSAGGRVVVAASTDGSTIVYNHYPFRRPGELTGQIFARVLDRWAGTDRAIGTPVDGSAPYRIVATAASRSGRSIALLSHHRLTEDAPASLDAGLYVFDTTTSAMSYLGQAPATAPNGASSISDDGTLVVGRDPSFNPTLLDRASGTWTSITDAHLTTSFDDFPSISGDGSTIVFTAWDSPDLDPTDRNGHTDVYAYDVATGTSELISVTTTGAPGNDFSHDPLVSADGNIVVFASSSDGLTTLPSCYPRGPDDGCVAQLYARDRTTGVTHLVSAGPGGLPGDGSSSDASISADGRFVAFTTTAASIDPTNALLAPIAGRPQLRDRARGITLPLQSASQKAMPFLRIWSHALSGDGRAFIYSASTLLTNQTINIFASSAPLAP